MAGLDIEGLRAFLTVVDEGHFGAAADLLRLPQPTLSRRIQRLEAACGTPLLTRTVRPVTTTQAGGILVGHARTIVAAADAAATGLERLSDGHDQIAKIGYVQSATYRWIGLLAAAAQEADLGLQLVASPGLRQLEAIRSQQLDAGLIRLDSVHHDVTGLEHRTIAYDPLYAILRDDEAVTTKSINAEGLRDRTLILYPETEGPGLRHLVHKWLNRTSQTKITEAWDAPSAVALAAAGTGIAVLPSPLPPLPANCRAVQLAGSPQLTLALVWHPHRDSNIRRILDRFPEVQGV